MISSQKLWPLDHEAGQTTLGSGISSVLMHSLAVKNVHFSQSEVLQWIANWFLYILHILQTIQSLCWYHMICNAAGFCAGYFITPNVIGTQALVSAQTQFPCSSSWKWPGLGPLEHFYMCVLINFFSCPCLWTYPSRALNFLAALQLYFFYVYQD
jgi:hypothetical protein